MRGIEVIEEKRYNRMTDEEIKTVVKDCSACNGFKSYTANAEYPISCRLGPIKLATALKCNFRAGNKKWHKMQKKRDKYETPRLR